MNEQTTESKFNPFRGLKRLRVPGMHICNAENGFMDYSEAFPPYVFMNLHDHLKHDCLVKKELDRIKSLTDEAHQKIKTPDDHVFAILGETMANMSYLLEEWSFIDDERLIMTVYGIADSMVLFTQRWLRSGLIEFTEGYRDIQPALIIDPRKKEFNEAARNEEWRLEYTNIIERWRKEVEDGIIPYPKEEDENGERP